MPMVNGQYLTDDEFQERGYRDQYPNAVQDAPRDSDWRPTPSGRNEPGGTTDAPADYWDTRLTEEAAKFGIKPGETDIANIKAKGQGDVMPYFEALLKQYGIRGGSNNFTTTQPGRPGATAPRPGTTQGFTSNYANVFSDPLTKQYEQLLQAQLSLYQQQQAAMQQAAAAAESRRASTGDAVKRLEEYVNQRVGKLQGPAYTGTEAEVLRTQFLDPLERDRDAARKRALEQISARGLTPESGVSAQLMQEVDKAFNEYRTRGQGAIATRQIEEQRSREQEAQELLKYLAMLPDAVARGDLDFVAYVQSLIAQPGQQGLTVGKLAADLPTERLNDALRTLGVGGSGGNTSAQLLQLLAQQQQQRQYQNALNANAWGSIGSGFF